MLKMILNVKDTLLITESVATYVEKAITADVLKLNEILSKEDNTATKPTQTYVQDLYSEHLCGTLVNSIIEPSDGANGISTVSTTQNGTLNITLSNVASDENMEIECNIPDFPFYATKARILTCDAFLHSSSAEPENVIRKSYDGIYRMKHGIKISLPKLSILTIVLQQ